MDSRKVGFEKVGFAKSWIRNKLDSKRVGFEKGKFQKSDSRKVESGIQKQVAFEMLHSKKVELEKMDSRKVEFETVGSWIR